MNAWYVVTILSAVFLFSCGSPAGEAVRDAKELPPLYPDYAGVTVPSNIAPLNFKVRGARHVRAEFFICDGATDALRSGAVELPPSESGLRGAAQLVVDGRRGLVDIPPAEWRALLDAGRGRVLAVQVSVWSDEEPDGVRYAPFAIGVAEEEIDDYVVYRLIEPGYEGWLQMGIYRRDLTSFDESVVVDNSVNDMGCVNCHSFCNYSADRMLFHARSAEGGTVFMRDGRTEKVDLTGIGPGRQGSYPRWNPDGRYVAFSSNDTAQSFFGGHGQPIEVYDQASDLMIYDTQTGRVLTDERFFSAERWETFPAWSPDGRSLFFCSAEPRQMPLDREQLRYDLLRVDFDPETGTLGERVDTLYNSRVEGGSVSFPRISPDGRFLMYTRADYATFPIWHEEADLAMADLAGGGTVDVSALNSGRAESYHAWSSSGRWTVFGSRRLDGRYTRLFIARVSADGVCGKPFLLPWRDPDHNQWRMKSYNIPEFVTERVELSRRELKNLLKNE